MKFSELSRKEEIGILHYFGDAEADLSDPRYDSRDVKSGSAFFAIKGYQTDGHRFIQAAIKNGASVIVLEDDAAFSIEDAEHYQVRRLLVSNSRLALAVVSEQAFGLPSQKLRMIGVTGTNGKTTVTNLIKQLLEHRGESVGLIGTIGITIGEEQLPATHTTPESRDISELLSMMLNRGVTTCVMEVSSHALYLDRVSALDFDIAVFTNLTQDHLDFHNTMEEYFAAKQLLFNNLRDTAVAVTNIDSEYGDSIVENTIANAHSYGVWDGKHEEFPLGHADLMASNVALALTGTTFNIRKRYSEENIQVEIPLIGNFNVENTLAAVSALYFGVEGFSLEVLKEGLRSIHSVRGRFEPVELMNGAVAIIDYAHTPDALEHVLGTIKSLSTSGTQVITVFGCGGDRDKGKRPIMGRIAAELSDKAIITNDNPRSEDPKQIARDILAGIPQGLQNKCQILLDRANAIAQAINLSKAGDVVLIAGKGHETYQIFGSESYHFDDREEVSKQKR